jgi:hypothetical protein
MPEGTVKVWSPPVYANDWENVTVVPAADAEAVKQTATAHTSAVIAPRRRNIAAMTAVGDASRVQTT